MAAKTYAILENRAYVILEDRGLLEVAGAEARGFLQGLISNDIDKVSPERAIYAALLTPQGKFLHDFFIAELNDRLVLDCEGGRIADLERRLTIYRLRAKVGFEDIGRDYVVAALMGENAGKALGLAAGAGAAAPFTGGVAFRDPRLINMGVRAILPAASAAAALEAAGFERKNEADYDRLRLELGLPDGSRDMVVEKALLLESGFEELGGVDFEKGCYVGQELTARTKYRGLVRKRLLRVDIDGPLPAPGTPIMAGGRQAGEVRSGRGGAAIALLRLDRIDEARASGEALTAGEARLKPVKPDWAAF